MQKLLILAMAAGAALTAVSPAAAAEGCGRGFHRNAYGECRPNRGPVIVDRGPRIGVFYANRGYWDGRRYYQHRYRWHSGWRYR